MKPRLVFSRIFFGNLKVGLYVKCKDKRYKRGFVCGLIRGVYGFFDGTRTLSLDTHFSYAYKQENSVIEVMNVKRYNKEWIAKRRDYLEKEP